MLAVDSRADRRYVITLSCPDTTGIVARISTFLAEAGGWIVEAGYHSDPDTNWFFTRQVVRAHDVGQPVVIADHRVQPHRQRPRGQGGGVRTAG